MARYYVHACDVCKELTSQRLTGYTAEGKQRIECESCGTEHQKTQAPVPKKKTTWPYYHGGCGVTFESESHEKAYTKAHGMTKE